MGSFESSIYVSSAPTVYPVTRDELKQHLRVDYTDDDTELDNIIQAATSEVENLTGLDIMERTRIWKFNDFPFGYRGELVLRSNPVQSITSIQYIDTDGATQTVATSVYDFDANSPRPVIFLKYNQVWPDARDIRNAVTVTYVTGYSGTGDSPINRANIPEPLRQGILMVGADLYEHKSGQATSNMTLTENKTLMRLLRPYMEHYF